MPKKEEQYGLWIPTLTPIDIEKERDPITKTFFVFDKLINGYLTVNCTIDHTKKLCSLEYKAVQNKISNKLVILLRRSATYTIEDGGLSLITLNAFKSAGDSDKINVSTFKKNLLERTEPAILNDCARSLVEYYHRHVHHEHTLDLLLGNMIKDPKKWKEEVTKNIISMYYKKAKSLHDKIIELRFPKATLNDTFSFGYKGAGELQYGKSFVHLNITGASEEHLKGIFDNTAHSLIAKQHFCNAYYKSQAIIWVLQIVTLFILIRAMYFLVKKALSCCAKIIYFFLTPSSMLKKKSPTC